MAYNPNEFVNRETEIDAFSGVLNDPSLRIFFLYGPEGIGKTSIVGRFRQDVASLDMCLFGVGVDFVDQLDAGELPTILYGRFEENGHILAPEAYVKTDLPGNEWTIVDADTQYKIRKEDEALNVYVDTVSVLVDFRDRSLDEPEHLLARLQERIGGGFADRLDRVGMDVLRQLSGESLSELLSQISSVAMGRVDITNSQEIKVEGDIVGGFKIVLNNSSITLPFGNTQFVQQAIERRLNTVFPQALQELVARHGRVLLFFDHFEKARQPIVDWLRHHLLNMQVEATDKLPDVWVLIAGRQIPYADEVDGWGYVLHTQSVKPLGEDAIRLYWVNKRKLDSDVPLDIIQECEGIPLLLFWLAEDAAAARRVPQP